MKVDEKLIKSFILLEDIPPSQKGDVISLRKYQGMVPVTDDDLYFDEEKNNHTFTKKFLLKNLGEKTEINEVFFDLKEKFNYLDYLWK